MVSSSETVVLPMGFEPTSLPGIGFKDRRVYHSATGACINLTTARTCNANTNFH